MFEPLPPGRCFSCLVPCSRGVGRDSHGGQLPSFRPSFALYLFGRVDQTVVTVSSTASMDLEVTPAV